MTVPATQLSRGRRAFHITGPVSFAAASAAALRAGSATFAAIAAVADFHARFGQTAAFLWRIAAVAVRAATHRFHVGGAGKAASLRWIAALRTRRATAHVHTGRAAAENAEKQRQRRKQFQSHNRSPIVQVVNGTVNLTRKNSIRTTGNP